MDRKTLDELAALKRNWLSDPCWDIEETEGFEDYKEHLVEYRKNNEIIWKAARQQEIHKIAAALGTDNLVMAEAFLDYFALIEKRLIRLENKDGG